MSVTDTDLELLESYLDDELGAAEADALRKRLSSDPQLSAAMDELRSQRDMRQQFFGAVEPNEASVQRLMQSVRRNVNREIIWAERSRKLGMVGSLAACIMVGFFIGRASYTMNRSTPESRPESPVAYAPPTAVFPGASPVVRPVSADVPKATDSREVVFDGPQIRNFGLSGINPNLILPTPRGQLVGGRLNLVDSNGNVLRQITTQDQLDDFMSQQKGTGSHSMNVAWPTK